MYTPCDSTRKPVPSATSAAASGAPGNIAAGPDFTGCADRIATTPCRAPATSSTNDPGYMTLGALTCGMAVADEATRASGGPSCTRQAADIAAKAPSAPRQTPSPG